MDSLQTLLDGPSVLVCAGNEAFRCLEMENDRGNRTRKLSSVTARSERGEWVLGLPKFFRWDSGSTRLVVISPRPTGKVLWPGSLLFQLCWVSLASFSFCLLYLSRALLETPGSSVDFNTQKFELKIFRV